MPGEAKQLPIAKVLSVGEGLRMEVIRKFMPRRSCKFSFQDGSVRPLNVAVGERVLLPEFGGQKIKLGEDEFDLYRDAEFLGKFSSED